MCARGAALHPHSSAHGTQVLTRFSRKTVAEPDRRQSQVLGAAVALVVSLVLLLVSNAKAHVPGCHSRACDRRVHEHRVQAWCLRHARCVWKHRWLAEEPSWRNWLRSTANCESRNRAHIATGNGYFGLVQFDLATWHAAGGHGYPHWATWYEQAVRAIEYAKRGHVSAWPVCGR